MPNDTDAQELNELEIKTKSPFFRYLLIGVFLAAFFAAGKTSVREYFLMYSDRIGSLQQTDSFYFWRNIFYYSIDIIVIFIGFSFSNVFAGYNQRFKKFLFLLILPLLVASSYFFLNYYLIAVFIEFFVLILIINLGLYLNNVFLKNRFPTFATSILFEKTFPDFENSFINKVRNIFNSENFLTVLRTALPNGSKSKENGFDFIPFMLHTVDERRKRFQKSSRNFLTMTIIVGVFFSIILTFFAYLLVNEAAAGTQKTLVDIETNTKDIGNQLQKIKPIESENIIDKVTQPIISLPQDESSEATNKIKNYLGSFSNYKNQVPPENLFVIMKDYDTPEKLKGLKDGTIIKYREGIQNLKEYNESRESLSTTIPNQIKRLDELIQKANESLNKPDNRIPDIIKRLFLSLALATFFIALLRYLVKLYRDHYQQLILAEEESLFIRKFYVSYKCCKDEEQRKAVLQSFMNNSNQDKIFGENGDDKNPTEINPDLLKDLLSAITKKL